MDVSIGSKTDLGTRENNEDAVLVVQPRNGELGAQAVLIVADGMGGRAYGEDASSTAVRTIRATLGSLLAPGAAKPPYGDALAAAIRRANSDVYELARTKSGQKGMGTTCVAAVIADDSATIAHVGDSRAYLLRDGLLRRLTEDHSYVHDQIKSGNLSDHDARQSRFRHVITKAIGIDPTVEPDIKTHKLCEGDTLLLCTDGLSNIVDEAGMIQIMSRARTAQEAIDYLVDAAKRGGSKDNISGALARIGVAEPDGLAATATGEQMHGSLTLERPAEAATIVDTGLGEDAKAGEASPRRVVAPVVGGAVIGALICSLVLAAVGWLHPFYVAPRPHKAVYSAAAVDYAKLSYGKPQVLLLDDVLPDLLAGGDAGVVVANARTGKLMCINAAGQIHEAGQIEPRPASSLEGRRFIASDAQGNVYITNAGEAMIRLYTADGKYIKCIGQGQIQQPASLWVARPGDIYVIDGGRLTVIRALPNGDSAGGKR
ncbi:MAG: protein phosphatase 2C domain-containing protein [Capsulimonadaceae bacterium]|nr:protein phosphatase 2C domain-containing protein [Capsulimonadaceae bacterium]